MLQRLTGNRAAGNGLVPRPVTVTFQVRTLRSGLMRTGSQINALFKGSGTLQTRQRARTR